MLKTTIKASSMFLAGLLLPMHQAPAAEVRAASRAFNNSCGYYSNTAAETRVAYRDTSLPWGTKVFLVHGLNGSELELRDGNWAPKPVEWKDRQVTEMPAVEPYVWATDLSFEVAERGGHWNYNTVAFVFRVQLPNGRAYFDNGNQSTWGYYTAGLNQPFPCLSGTEEQKPAFQRVEVRVINK